MVLWRWGPLIFNACLVTGLLLGFAAIAMQPELLVSWFFGILRTMPYYAAYAAKRMYDQLTHEMRNMFSPLPPGRLTLPTNYLQQANAAANDTTPNLEMLDTIMQRLDQQDRNTNLDVGAAALAVLGTAAVVLAKKR